MRASVLRLKHTLGLSIKCWNHLRFQLQTKLEEVEGDISKQTKLRERAENYSKELEQELESLRQTRANMSTVAQVDNSAELQRLKQELENVRLE
mgnify:CR=1 FL=1